MTKEKKEKMLEKAKRLYADIDSQLQKEHAKEWFGKNAVTLRNARENLEFMLICLDKLDTEGEQNND